MTTETRTRRIHLQFATFVACAILSSATNASAQPPAAKVQSFTWVTNETTKLSLNGYNWLQSGGVDELKGHGVSSTDVSAVSANGTAVAGYLRKSQYSDMQVFVWSKAVGFKEIAKIHYYDGLHVDFVSDDGSVVLWVAGYSFKKGEAGGSHLIRWSRAGGAKDLGGVEAGFEVKGASADGSEIFGDGLEADLRRLCHRWTQQGGLQIFPAMDQVLSVSTDGTMIVGTKADHVIRWTQAGGAQDLGAMKTDTKTLASFFPERASVDGTTIAGSLRIYKVNDAGSFALEGDHASLWTQAGGVQDLGSMGGKSASLDDISADGTVVVGTIKQAGGMSFNFFVSPVPDLLAKRQAELKVEQATKQAQAAAHSEAQAKAAALQAEQQAKTDAIAIDQQNRYDKVINTGRPAQLYSLAGHLEDEGRPDLAAGLYQALIDKFPDNPYTAKAIDKEDAARAAAQQQQQQAQDSAAQTVATNAPSPQVIEACIQQCSTTLNSCKADAQTQHDSAVAKGLVGLLSKNAGMVGGAGTDSQNADSAKSACNDDYNSCSAACQ